MLLTQIFKGIFQNGGSWDYDLCMAGAADNTVYICPGNLHMDCHVDCYSALSYCGNPLCLAASRQVQIYSLSGTFVITLAILLLWGLWVKDVICNALLPLLPFLLLLPFPFFFYIPPRLSWGRFHVSFTFLSSFITSYLSFISIAPLFLLFVYPPHF